MSIRYLNNNEINYYRWDRCIKNAFNSLIYGYSWYLNTVCQDWSALIEGDYESVMPLPLISRFGLKGVQTPCFVNQLGIFSSKLISPDKVKEFFRAIPSKILFIDLCINKFNKTNWKGTIALKKSHFELDLIKSYQKMSKDYDGQLKAKLAEAQKNKLTVLKRISPGELFKLNRILQKSAFNKIREARSRLLKSLVSTSLRYHFGELFGVYDTFNTLCCAAFFVWSENRAILLFSATSPEGTRENAFHFLIDHFIKVNSNRFITLNFDYSELYEYSDVYKQFGAIESDYQNIIKNRIPFASIIFNKQKMIR
ncbi:MAG: hypothetical protein JW723_13215 [Bacteroidales bacterium]|nr:hypothetical protein [Bacteroidales bacterium]